MSHYTTPAFWAAYEVLPAQVQRLADKNFALLKADRDHPSLHLKRVGPWIGPHGAYDRLIR